MRNQIIIRLILLVALLMAIAGCSSQTPVEPINSTITMETNTASMVNPPENQIKFSAHVATIDLAERQLTFNEVTYVLDVPENCNIIQIVDGITVTLELTDIKVGDLVEVCSFLQDDGTIIANQIVLCSCTTCPGYDIAFQDSIATINYTAKSFTVYGYSETFIIDDNTVIWGKTPGPISLVNPVDTVYSFNDLKIGYILEIKANVIDETTMLAINIKVLNCNFRPSIDLIF